MKLGTLNAHDSSLALRRALDVTGQLLLVQEHVAPRTTPVCWDYEAAPGNLAIYWQPRFLRHVETTWHQAHGGRRFRIGGTPRRGTQVSLFHVHLDLNTEIAVLNGHRINRTRGAWRRVPGVQAKLRARLWRKHDQLDRQLVAELIGDGCRLIVYGGDWNRREVAPLHPAARRLTGARIDQLWLIDLDNQLRVGQADAVRRLGSDHPLRRVHLFRNRRS